MRVQSPDLGLSRLPAVYRPRPAAGFTPARIVLAKGSNGSPARCRLVDAICAAYPRAEVVEAFDTPHNRIRLRSDSPLDRHREGKQTLVLAEHHSAVRQSTENGNTCPNYWHFSPYGFCPYGCAYCYLAGTQGVWFSPTVKVFVNLPEILDQVDAIARRLGRPTAFYLGKLQDGLALDRLTGYSQEIVPFFAEHPLARLTLLTKSADVGNLLGIRHGGRTILSWTLSPQVVVEAYEPNTPSLEERLQAMEACAQAGYPVRAVIMPILPLPDWETIYGRFLVEVLRRVRLRGLRSHGCLDLWRSGVRSPGVRTEAGAARPRRRGPAPAGHPAAEPDGPQRSCGRSSVSGRRAMCTDRDRRRRGGVRCQALAPAGPGGRGRTGRSSGRTARTPA
ncbi:MAG: hypothetical protein RBS80_18185 [Thermoguttaceae bacterium]|nr:hypothetical protein [Thermoguttaceae bacterium]